MVRTVEKLYSAESYENLRQFMAEADDAIFSDLQAEPKQSSRSPSQRITEKYLQWIQSDQKNAQREKELKDAFETDDLISLYAKSKDKSLRLFLEVRDLLFDCDKAYCPDEISNLSIRVTHWYCFPRSVDHLEIRIVTQDGLYEAADHVVLDEEYEESLRLQNYGVHYLVVSLRIILALWFKQELGITIQYFEKYFWSLKNLEDLQETVRLLVDLGIDKFENPANGNLALFFSQETIKQIVLKDKNRRPINNEHVRLYFQKIRSFRKDLPAETESLLEQGFSPVMIEELNKTVYRSALDAMLNGNIIDIRALWESSLGNLQNTISENIKSSKNSLRGWRRSLQTEIDKTSERTFRELCSEVLESQVEEAEKEIEKTGKINLQDCQNSFNQKLEEEKKRSWEARYDAAKILENQQSTGSSNRDFNAAQFVLQHSPLQEEFIRIFCEKCYSNLSEEQQRAFNTTIDSLKLGQLASRNVIFDAGKKRFEQQNSLVFFGRSTSESKLHYTNSYFLGTVTMSMGILLIISGIGLLPLFGTGTPIIALGAALLSTGAIGCAGTGSMHAYSNYREKPLVSIMEKKPTDNPSSAPHAQLENSVFSVSRGALSDSAIKSPKAEMPF